MSVSAKNNPKIIKSIKSKPFFLPKNMERDSSIEKLRKHLSLKNAFYEIDLEKKNDIKLPVLNYITNNSSKRSSAKTAFTTSASDRLDYDLCMINKYDENLNSNLSFISDFDLEEDKKENNSFDSCDNDDSCIEEIEIKTNEKIIDNIDDDDQYELKFEKDWNDIQKVLLKNESAL
jgi:hypothetical protein